jgi:hypothetical protein
MSVVCLNRGICVSLSVGLLVCVVKNFFGVEGWATVCGSGADAVSVCGLVVFAGVLWCVST